MMRIRDKIKTRFLKARWQYLYTNYALPSINLNMLFSDIEVSEPTITENICLPPYYGEKGLLDYSTLMIILKNLNPKYFLELGTAHGNTVANVCSNCEAKVVTINALPEQIEGKVVTFTLSKDEIGYVYKKYGFANRVTQIYENTKNLNVLDFLASNSVDLVIIDACHDSDFVVNDFLKIIPSLSKRSIVLLHDTHPSLKMHYIDSYIGCMFLRKLGFNVCHVKNTSWGIWKYEGRQIQKFLAPNLCKRLLNVIDQKIFGSLEEDVKRTRRYAKRFIKIDN